ncbi:uncharacterized protein [Halyomorpha halys]|uniref:uncharacterized protein n=1 Tax=Halyomorpha halys TaxID=286706 RepID=UPI0006D4D7C2|nr:uncharacterized protein LOC106684129 [Halyomorpha halys]
MGLPEMHCPKNEEAVLPEELPKNAQDPRTQAGPSTISQPKDVKRTQQDVEPTADQNEIRRRKTKRRWKDLYEEAMEVKREHLEWAMRFLPRRQQSPTKESQNTQADNEKKTSSNISDKKP